MYRGRGNNKSYRGRGVSHSRGRGRGRTQQRGLFANGIWHCDCTPSRLPAEHFKVKKEGPNTGRWFYTCQQSDKGCGFFLWEEDAKPREEAALLSGSRSEPRREGAQEGWDAGRSTVQQRHPPGKGLFARNDTQTKAEDGDASTASPSPTPTSKAQPSTKRTARDADLDDEFGLEDLREQDLAGMAASMPLETPHKAQKTGVYATPATTTAKRKLPWLEEPSTPRASNSSTNAANGYFDTPSKAPSQPSSSLVEPQTPAAPPTAASAASPEPPARYKDALQNPNDSTCTLTHEVLETLTSVEVPPDILEKVRTACTRHDMKYQGAAKGRDMSRLAMKAKDAKITELQARIASLEADREVERALSRMKKWESGRQGLE